MTRPRLVCRNSRPRLAGLLALDLALVALCAWCVTQPRLAGRVAGGLGLAFFGVGLVLIPARWGRTGPMLVIDDRGIEVRHQRIGLVPWSAIRSVRLGNVSGSKFLCVDLVDPTALAAGWGPVSRRIRSLNAALGYGDLTISASGLVPGIDAVWRHLVDRFEAADDPAGG